MEPVQIKVQNTFLSILNYPDLEELEDVMRVRYTAFIPIKNFETGEIRFQPKAQELPLVQDGFYFPAGLYQRITNYLKRKRVPVNVIDLRRPPGGIKQYKTFNTLEIVKTLRYYQLNAFKKARVAFRGIIQHPPGSGKTHLDMALTAATRCYSLHIHPNTELMKQAYRKFSPTFPGMVGMIGDKRFDLELPISIANIQTLWARYDYLMEVGFFDRIGLLILEEAHHVNKADITVNTWYTIAQSIPAYWRFGLTATPGEVGSPDRALLEATTGKIIDKVPFQELEENGFLTRSKVFMVKYEHQRSYPDWHVAKKVGLGLNMARNNIIAAIATMFALQGKRVLIVVDRVEDHGKILQAIIGEGLSQFIHGKHNGFERLLAEHKFRANTKPILIGTIFGEGVDFPYMDVVIKANGGRSTKQAVQNLGRCVRLYKGKRVGICVDIYDIDEGKKRTLLNHSDQRYAVYKTASTDVQIVGSLKEIKI